MKLPKGKRTITLAGLVLSIPLVFMVIDYIFGTATSISTNFGGDIHLPDSKYIKQLKKGSNEYIEKGVHPLETRLAKMDDSDLREFINELSPDDEGLMRDYGVQMVSRLRRDRRDQLALQWATKFSRSTVASLASELKVTNDSLGQSKLTVDELRTALIPDGTYRVPARIVWLMQSLGPQFTFKDFETLKPLHYFAVNILADSWDSIEHLAIEKKHLELMDEKGRLAIELARDSNNQNFVQFLLSKGAQADLRQELSERFGRKVIFARRFDDGSTIVSFENETKLVGYADMKVDGVTVFPTFKLGPDGKLDTTFQNSLLTVAAEYWGPASVRQQLRFTTSCKDGILYLTWLDSGQAKYLEISCLSSGACKKLE